MVNYYIGLEDYSKMYLFIFVIVADCKVSKEPYSYKKYTDVQNTRDSIWPTIDMVFQLPY